MEMGLVQKTFGSQNNSVECQENLISTPFKALIATVTTVASAAFGFLLADLAGLAIGTLVGIGLGVMAIVIASNFMRQAQTDPNVGEKVVSISNHAKKTVIVTPKNTPLETQPPEIDTRPSLTHFNLADAPLTTLPIKPNAIKNEELTNIPEQVLAKDTDKKSQFNSPISNQVVKIGICETNGNALEACPAEISDLPPFTNLDRNSNPPHLLLPEQAGIEIQGITDVTDPDSAESLIKFYKRLPIDGKPQFDDGSKTEQARKIQNWMKENPEALNLKSLDLSNSELTRLPNEIGLFVHLKELNLRGNQLEALPAGIGNLHSLTHLNLNKNKLKVVPLEIGNLPSLMHLTLGHNWRVIFPPKIGNLNHVMGGIYKAFRS